MNTIQNFEETNILDNITLKLSSIGENIEVLKYSKKNHKEGKYSDDFIYIYNKDTNTTFILKNLDLKDFNKVNECLSDENFDVFCYSKKNTGTMYNSYKPIGDSFQLIIKARIDNLINL